MRNKAKFSVDLHKIDKNMQLTLALSTKWNESDITNSHYRNIRQSHTKATTPEGYVADLCELVYRMNATVNGIWLDVLTIIYFLSQYHILNIFNDTHFPTGISRHWAEWSAVKRCQVSCEAGGQIPHSRGGKLSVYCRGLLSSSNMS